MNSASVAAKTKITVLGTSGAMPGAGNDTASFVINDTCLVDTGWSSAMNLLSVGIDPGDIECMIFTHFHHDHYMSLPAMLYYFLRSQTNRLTIVGPEEELERIVSLSFRFLQKERYFNEREWPALVPLRAGESYECDTFVLDACAALHPVPALCYRYRDKSNESYFSFTGDTAYYPPMIDHIKNSALLIHEASLGPVAADPQRNAYLHSGAVDAGKLARQSGVGKLLLLHGPRRQARECVEAARSQFFGEVEWPETGQTYYV